VERLSRIERRGKAVPCGAGTSAGYGGALKAEDVRQREWTETQQRRISELLDRIRKEFHARLVLLVESRGHPLASSGDAPDWDLTSVSSLAASAVAATGQLAHLLGETAEGLALRHEGREFLHLIPNGRTLLALAFDAPPPSGLEEVRARLRLKRALAQLETALGPALRDPGLPSFSEEEVEAALEHRLRPGR
jgi:hypothetical protein